MASFSAIAENVQTMDSIPTLRTNSKKLRFVSLHSNHLRHISSLDKCYYLEDLDLSSNKLASLSGLEACEGLLKLNLSCNQIRVPTGLDFLYKLKTLNLSYNKIANVNSLSHFAEKRFQLETLMLHGNKLSSLPGTAGTLRRILTLNHLTLHSNPLCSNQSYRKVLGDCMPQLQSVDDFPRVDDSFSESVTTDSSLATIPIATPYIDKAVRSYKHQLVSSPEQSDSSEELAKEIREEKEGRRKVEEMLEEEEVRRRAEVMLPQESDYTDLIKQVLTIIREEEVPVKLSKDCQRPDITPEKEASPEPEAATLKQTPTSEFPDARAIDIESIRSTNKLLLQELEAERERRWKSEKHITSLSDKMVKNDHAIKEYEELNRSSEAGINGIRDLLMKEQGQKMKLAGLLENFKEKHREVVRVLAEKEGFVKERECEIERLRRVVDGIKRTSVDTSKEHKLALQQTKQEAQVQRKQCELLRHELSEHAVRVTSLQELVVTREQAHVREKDNLVPLHGPDFNKRVQELVQVERDKHELMNRNLIQSARDWQQKHVDLEKEFRIALFLEEKRYMELHGSYTKLSGQVSGYRGEISRLKSEGGKQLGLIDKLKRSVNEQSGAIDRLCAGNRDLEGSTRLKIGALERELQESTKSLVELSGFQKDNQTLKGEISAQQSVIEGLRAERHLWSKELAEQGAQLSLDRGTLESELGRLRDKDRDQEERLRELGDRIKIKQHQLDDVQGTVLKLKEVLNATQQDHQQEMARMEESVKLVTEEREEAEGRVEALRESLHSCQEDRDRDRGKIHSQADEVDTVRRRYKDLKKQWESRVAAFEKIEKAAGEMQELHEGQMREVHVSLQQERDVITRLKDEITSLQNQHDSTLKQKELELREEVDGVRKEGATRESEYTSKIATLEQEMRMIIHQSQQLKQDNDAKLTKLASALGEFTSFLQPK